MEIGIQSKKLIKKTYASSEDERPGRPLARSPSPAPRFMKEEIANIKKQSAAQEIFGQNYNSDYQSAHESKGSPAK